MAGAGPAGLSAALMLGRCRRRVLVCDTGEPRNRWSLAVHGFLTRDGTAPAMLLALAREELRRYDTVELRVARVIDAERVRDGFQVRCGDGCEVHARKLLLATGVVDELHAIAGIEAFYGRSVHHCPYCDGWEWRDRPIASYGREEHGAALALGLSVWSRDVILCTDGAAALPARTRALLERLGIRHLFQAVVTSEDVERQKPAPDIFLEAARRLGVPPQLCRAYEDTDLGMQAIRTAGMEAVDVRKLLVAGR